MKEQSIVHIKVDYDEALQSKRDILASERDFLRIIKRIKRYKLLRGEELNSNITKLNQILPKVKLPNILKKKEEAKKKEIKEEKQSKIEIKEIHEDDDLERQLIEIQEKLRKLG